MVFHLPHSTEQKSGTEQSRWEETHLNAAIMSFGAKDAKQKKKTKEYEVIMEEEIEFVQVDR